MLVAPRVRFQLSLEKSLRMINTFHWLDVVQIAEALVDAHPDIDPLTIAFPKLKSLVQALKGFQEQPGHPGHL